MLNFWVLVDFMTRPMDRVRELGKVRWEGGVLCFVCINLFSS